MAPTTIASLVTAADAGDATAADALFAALYADLHRLARQQLARSDGRLTLGVTTLLHEAYLDISERDGVTFVDRSRFMAYAARVMRGLIIDYARNRQTLKRGGEFVITTLVTDIPEPVADAAELTRISDVLDELMSTEPALAQVVDLKFFCGFSFVEIATMQRVSERTVRRLWEKARIYLHAALRP
jgi:RNA polymerase sigma factor (TIGR02999 family)